MSEPLHHCFDHSASTVGTMGERAFILECSRAGLKAYSTSMGDVVDVLVESPRGFFRVQVKSARLSYAIVDGKKYYLWRWPLVRIKKMRKHITYSPNELEVFALYRVEKNSFTYVPLVDGLKSTSWSYQNPFPANPELHFGVEVFDTLVPYAAPRLGLTPTNTMHLSTPNLITTPSQYALDLLHS